MQFSTVLFTLLAAAGASSAAAVSNAPADHAAFVRRLAHIDAAPVEKRECQEEKYKECAEPCSAFGGTAGSQIAQGMCVLSCGNIYGC